MGFDWRWAAVGAVLFGLPPILLAIVANQADRNATVQPR